jgi:general secretion pathway protein G
MSHLSSVLSHFSAYAEWGRGVTKARIQKFKWVNSLTHFARPLLHHPMSPCHMLNRKSGFTLVEMIAAIAIITILAAILLPIFGKIRESGNASKCISNMKQIGVGAAAVIAENNGMLPNRLDTIDSPRFTRSIADYIYPNGKGRPSDGGVFRCPSADDKKTSSIGASLGSAGKDYNYLCYGRNNAIAYGPADEGLTYRVSQIAKPSKRALAWEANKWNISNSPNDRYAPRHRGAPTANNPRGEAASFLFIDGHVEMRVMSMNPIDQQEWDELGIGGARENMTR